MRVLVVAAIATAAFLQSALAEERSPLVQKIVELGIANQVVPAKCPGWSVNPQVIALAVMAVGLAGQQKQLEAVTQDEVFQLAEEAKKASLLDAQQCEQLKSQSIPDPFNTGNSIPLFLRSAN